MNVSELQEKLNEIRTEAVNIIKDVMASISTTDINILEIEVRNRREDICLTSQPLTHNGDEPYALASISLCPDGNLLFESNSEFDTITEGECDLSADTLLEIAQWMEENQETFAQMGQDEEETMTVLVDWGGLNASVLGLDEEVEVPARLDGADVDDYLEEMYGFRPAGWESI